MARFEDCGNRGIGAAMWKSQRRHGMAEYKSTVKEHVEIAGTGARAKIERIETELVCLREQGGTRHDAPFFC